MRITPLAFRSLATRALCGTLVLAAFGLAACSDDSTDNNGGGGNASTDYVGLLASTNGQTGPLNLTFAIPVAAPPALQEPGSGPSLSSGAPAIVTGTLQLGAGPVVTITGVLDDNDVLAMSGGGYDLLGDLDDGLITGGFTNAGIVLIEGAFVAASSTEGSPAYAFCGTFEGQDAGDPPPPTRAPSISWLLAESRPVWPSMMRATRSRSRAPRRRRRFRSTRPTRIPEAT
jgi:hypothetical protein